jgi:hypothetical protein
VRERRSARDVVEGITRGFEVVDANDVRHALETHESASEVNVALGELGKYLEEVIDPEIVVDFSAFQSALTPDAPARFDGPEGWQQMWRLWLEAWEDYEPQIEIEEFDDEHILVTASATLKGHGSGVEIDWVTVGIWTVRDGRLVGMHNFLTRGDALAALQKGLP